MSETTSNSEAEIPGWWVKFVTAAIEQLPRPGSDPGKIDQTTAEAWTKNQAGLKTVFVENLLPLAVATPVKTTPARPTLLEFLGTVKTSATTEPFIAKDRFVVNTDDDAPVKIWEVWSGFKTRFLQGDGKVEQSVGDTELRYHRLKKRSVDSPILEELGGGKKPRTTFTEVWTLLTKQPKGEKGTLLVNGYANIFYVETEVILPEEGHLVYTNDEGKKVVLCAVYVRWHAGRGWSVDAYSVLSDYAWSDGSQVFSRNSAL